MQPRPFQCHTRFFYDERGSLSVLFEGDDFNTKIVKMTESKKGVLRGFHYQYGQFKQRKRIIVLEGVIQDVILKVDENQKLTGEIYDVILDAQGEFNCLDVPAEWAHSYLTLSDQSKILYFCDNNYGQELSFNPLKNYDQWKIDKSEMIISEKDLKSK